VNNPENVVTGVVIVDARKEGAPLPGVVVLVVVRLVLVPLATVFTSVYVNEVAELPVTVNCSSCKNDEYTAGTVRTSTPALDTTRSNPNRRSPTLLAGRMTVTDSGDSALCFFNKVKKIPCRNLMKPKILLSLCI